MEGGKPDEKPGDKTRPDEARPEGDEDRRRKRLRWGIVGLAVVVALIAWLATRGGGESSSEPGPGTETPPGRIVTEAELKEATQELGQPIYWAGPMAGKELELRELGAGGGAQVAYLPEGAEAGQDSSTSLTIGSYPLADPAKAVEGYAGRPGSNTIEGTEGREVVSSEAAPTSAYFASPDNSVQVEVYDPSPKRALELAASGQVKPVE